ncbi:MAG: diacylglycerol kinase family protein [Prevotellaceae bacterium]|jgi:diacylglycerol kinase|nr:diacylglycerol kinase family protein [Prevotellaceae bacterium]
MFTSVKKEIRSFACAFKGIISAFKSEVHLKIHAIIVLIVCVCGFVFQISAIEWIVCLLCISVVIGMELLNSAIERLTDLIEPEYNDLAGKAKDIAAGAVLTSAIISIIAGIIIFAPKIF